jgi:DNA-binding GntR family transcriptional regulator
VAKRFPATVAKTADRARGEKLAALEDLAEEKRRIVAGTSSPTKMAVYREKYAVAILAINGDEFARRTLEPEATARGETPLDLALLVKQLGDNWRDRGLKIDAAYQTHKKALLALTTDIEVDAYDITTGWPE